jgi:hypothetical protein
MSKFLSLTGAATEAGTVTLPLIQNHPKHAGTTCTSVSGKSTVAIPESELNAFKYQSPGPQDMMTD